MKSLIAAAALLAAAFPALAQTNVSISVGQPGFYGRIDLGDFGPPPVVYAQPIVVERAPRYVAEPVYLRVPEGHRRHWARFCGRYNACGRPVYFVQDSWYTNTYVPRYREVHYEHYREPAPRVYYQRAPERHEYRDRREEWHGHGEGHGHDGDHGHGHDGDHGHGEGHGRGHGHG